jgi:transcriptional regulator with XRE-family HTH domain
MHISKRLRELMEARGIDSQAELGRQTGIPQGMIARWLADDNGPSVKNRRKLEAFFGEPLGPDSYFDPDPTVLTYLERNRKRDNVTPDEERDLLMTSPPPGKNLTDNYWRNVLTGLRSLENGS